MEDELEQRAADYLSSVLGFNGERIDPVLGGYHLGNGYRLYSPSLRRFTSPDSMSPFGQGGINPYAYCEGDPINNTDPTGHMPLRRTVHRVEEGVEVVAASFIPGVGEGLDTGLVVKAEAREGESLSEYTLKNVGKDATKGHRRTNSMHVGHVITGEPLSKEERIASWNDLPNERVKDHPLNKRSRESTNRIKFNEEVKALTIHTNNYNKTLEQHRKMLVEYTNTRDADYSLLNQLLHCNTGKDVNDYTVTFDFTGKLTRDEQGRTLLTSKKPLGFFRRVFLGPKTILFQLPTSNYLS